MSKLRQSLFVALVYVCLTPIWGANLQRLGPEGGHIVNILTHPTDPLALLAMTAHGPLIWGSTNGGASWTLKANLQSNSGSDLVSQDLTTIYAKTDQGYRRSIDGGASWSAMTTPNLLCLEADPVDPAKLHGLELEPSFSGETNDTLHYCYSPNGGANWSRVRILADLQLHPQGILVSPSNPSILYAYGWRGENTSLLYKSTNGGAAWTAVQSSPMSGLRIHPSDPNKLIGWFQGIVYHSFNGGESFSLTWQGETVDLVFDRISPDKTYLLTRDGLFISPDFGASWEQANFYTDQTETALAVTGGSPATIFIGSTSELRASVSGGSTWISGQTGLTASAVESISPVPHTASDFLAVIGGWGLKRRVFGAWADVPFRNALNQPLIPADAILTASSHIIACDQAHQIYQTTNNGATWSMIENAQGPLLAQHPLRPSNLYAGGTDNGNFALYMSQDYGATFTRTGPADLAGECIALAFAPSNPNVFYAANRTPAGATSYVRFTNLGAVWTIRTGLSASLSGSQSILVDSQDALVLYAGCGDRLYRSSNGGNSWSEWSKPILPGPDSDQDLTITSLIFGPGNISLLAGTNQGIYRRDNRTGEWLSLSPAFQSQFLHLTGHTLYAGTKDQGLLKLEMQNAARNWEIYK